MVRPAQVAFCRPFWEHHERAAHPCHLRRRGALRPRSCFCGEQKIVANSVNQNAVAAGDLIFGGNVVPKVEHGWDLHADGRFRPDRHQDQFGAADGRTVTLEIYDELPGEGGTLLRSGTFSAVANQFAGAFAELTLEAGEDYFIGFRNLAGLGANTTKEAGAVELPAFFCWLKEGAKPASVSVKKSSQVADRRPQSPPTSRFPRRPTSRCSASSLTLVRRRR